MGVSVPAPKLDLPAMMNFKQQGIDGNVKGVEFLMKKNKIDWVKGFGILQPRGANGLHRIVVKGSDGAAQTLETKNVIIATGSGARMLPGLEPDAKTILTNIEILDLPAIPKSMLIIGAGAVGVEFASIFNRFGTKVTVIEMLPRIVPIEDEEISKELDRYFRKTGIRCETGARAENIIRTENGVRMCVALANGKREDMEAETLLVAVGRKPMTEGIGLENLKVELDRGFIKVDQFQQTGEPGVYAIGDVVAGTPQLAHVAKMEGMVACAHMTGKPAKPINKNRIPSCTYTEPGIGSVGLTEAQARAQGLAVKIGKFPFSANSKASIMGNHTGFIKVVADEKFGEILGVHIIGPEAFELISEAVTAMEAEATVETMMHTIHAHPTLYEAMGEAFNNVYGLTIDA
jgi:dihydrolipoyl dehydrogenase